MGYDAYLRRIKTPQSIDPITGRLYTFNEIKSAAPEGYDCRCLYKNFYDEWYHDDIDDYCCEIVDDSGDVLLIYYEQELEYYRNITAYDMNDKLRDLLPNFRVGVYVYIPTDIAMTLSDKVKDDDVILYYSD